jgi:hypothetical protein
MQLDRVWLGRRLNVVGLAVVVCGLPAACTSERGSSQPQPGDQHFAQDVAWRHELDLPSVESKTSCPVQKTPPRGVPGRLFGPGIGVLGHRSVYIAIFSDPPYDPYLHKSIDLSAQTGGQQPPRWVNFKFMLIANPHYSGRVVLRGARLDAAGHVLFSVDALGGSARRRRQVIDASRGTHWRKYPNSLLVRGPGCYGIRIDAGSHHQTISFLIVP